MSLVPFPGFLGATYQALSSGAARERCVNLFPAQQQGSSGPYPVVYFRTPGLSRLVTLDDSPGRGIFRQDGVTIAVAGQSVYHLNEITGAATKLGLIANDLRPVSLVSNGAPNATGHQLLIISATRGYIVDLQTFLLSPIIAPGFPQGAALCGSFQDKYFLVARSDRPEFQISALNDGLTWDADLFAEREIGSDGLAVALTCGHYYYLLGTLSTEVWVDAGGADFPYTLVTGAFFETGCAAKDSAISLDGAVIWLAQSRFGGRFVASLEAGSQFGRISNDAIDAVLSACPSVSDFVAYGEIHMGHTFYVLTSPSNNLTLVYDRATQLWHERMYLNPATGQEEAVRPWVQASWGGQNWCLDRANGNVYVQSLTTYTDDGAAIRWIRRAPAVGSLERRYTSFSELRIGFDVGMGLRSGQGSAPYLMMRYSDDKGRTWSPEHWVSAGPQGQYLVEAHWTRLGRTQYQNRVFEVSGSEPIPTCLLGAWLQ